LKVSAYNKNLELLKPENVLQRGYTITLFNGEIRKSKAGLQPGDKIETQFHDGIVSSRIMEEQEET
jgi:exodeoxyribonuclease VII large subunit